MSDLAMRLTARPLYLQVRDALVARVTAGEWKPGGALPNEIHLAQEMQISVGTVRKALDIMVSADRYSTPGPRHFCERLRSVQCPEPVFDNL